MKKLLFIFNPSAGRETIRTRLYQVVCFYKDKGYVTTIYPLSNQRDGYEFIKNYGLDYDLVVCSGGDGTLNEMVAAFMDGGMGDVPLAYIPSGSTNDFARSLEMPFDFQHALENSVRNERQKVDVGKFNDSYFAYIAAFGAFTSVSYSTPREMKKQFGYLAYVLEGIKSITDLREYHVELTSETGLIKGEFIFGMITNTFSVGGFKNPVGNCTKLNDGVFEVLLIRKPANLFELHDICNAFVFRRTVDSRYMVLFQAATISITSEPIKWTLDGEYVGEYKNVNIINVNKAIRIVNVGIE